MERIGEYMIGVTAAGLLCALVGKLSFDGLTGAMLRLVCGLFMALAVVAPWKEFSPDFSLDWVEEIRTEGEAMAAQGENSARQAMAERISEQVRSYILDKAEDLGLMLEVSVRLSEDAVPVPMAVTLRGQASPYCKSVLEDYIRDNLGIGKEAQTWIT